MLATLNALREMGGSAKLDELDERVIESAGITEIEQGYLMPDGRRPRVNYYLAWARTFLGRGHALVNSRRGVWALTDLGEQITTATQCQQIYAAVNAEERERARLKRIGFKPVKEESKSDLVPLTEILPEATATKDDRDWKSRLLDIVNEMTADAFERLSQRLMREAGFVRVEVRGKTGDGGIDGVGILRVNLISFQVYFQCKKWRSSVGAREIRDFRGALQGRADKGLFITTGSFTAQASDEASRDGAIAIDLIDGERLCDLLKEYDLGVTTRMVEAVDIHPAWFGDL